MSQHPSRPPGGGGGGWPVRPNAPSPFRPASPYSPCPSPHPQQYNQMGQHPRSRGPSTPVYHHHQTTHPMSPLSYPPGMMHPMSPVPIGMPISPGMSPVFGCPTPGYIQCPRPRWPSPVSSGNPAPRPYIPSQHRPQSPMESGGGCSPVPCGPPEYLIAPYRSGDYEYVGVPLDPSRTDDEDSGPSTAEIIASQSQDYVDEKLAEYQATIQLLQDEQERVQKKTFVNWINSYLSKRVPPLRVDNLIEDLKDGTRLLALLEVLSGEKLSVERGRNLKRPHFLSNANTALQFLQSKKIKLVNINSSDLVDGRPPVVLGLIWTIILYFQIEENTRALEYLGQSWGSQSSLESLGTQGSAASERKRISSEKWKQGARKTLLQWVTNALPKEAGIRVKDFGESWRDGNAFLAIIDAIRANLVSIAAMRKASNRARLETAFEVAEVELGIARLLDPEDVDVPQPDEKSIMTYVAQFLHKYPEPKSTGPDSFAAIQQEYDALVTWLNERTRHLEQLDRGNAFPSSFTEYMLVRTETDEKSVIYKKLQGLVDTPSMISITRDSWKHVQTLWNKMEYLLLKWLWLLDSSLPGELGELGRWLALAENLLNSDEDIPDEMNEETAGIISNKLDDHKKFFLDLEEMTEKFQRARNSPLARQAPPEQLDNMSARFESLPLRAAKRRIKLKFLEHKCCLVAFLFLVETKLKGWSVKYGTEEQVNQMLEQYRNIVSRNRVFQEFQKAYLDMQQVVEEYKREGDVDRDEAAQIDRFMRETAEKWKNVSMDLRCVQSMLEEVVAYWRRWTSVSEEFEAWLSRAEPAIELPEEEKMEFFQDISVWKDKHQQLSDSVSFLIATSDEQVALHLKDRYTNLTSRWEKLFPEAKQYMHAGDLLRNRKDYRSGVESLQNWLRNAEAALSTSQLTSTEKIKAYGENLQVLHNEVESIEELFKSISKKFQTLIQDLSREEVDKMMMTLKKEKEALVRVRALIPMQLHLYHQLLVQQESLEAGQKEISNWLDEAERLLTSVNLAGGRDSVLAHLDRHKAFFSRTLYYKSMLESKNKVFSSIVKSVDAHANVETAEGGAALRALNDRFSRASQLAQLTEQRLQEAVRCWGKFRECEKQISEWLTAAESLINDKRIIDNRQSVEHHKNFFGKVNERWIQDLINAGQDLRNALPAEQQAPIIETVEALQKRWREVLNFAPLHLMRLEFRLDEVAFMQYLKEIEVEINSEQQALIKNDDVESILERNKEFFVNRGVVLDVERCLQTLKKISSAYSQLKPGDSSLKESAQKAEQLWENSAQRVESLREQLRQVPEQWAAYRNKFDEMGRWMDHVDNTLRTILKEVNTLEEFETEKTIFQKVCHEADSKREEMKWLVQTLDSLTSNRSDREAVTEQSHLEQLITRYKNLIPTIEITMTKTDIYSKSYTYRKEVREVCTLLRKVREQSTSDAGPKSPERLKEAVSHQETRLNQLEQQRANIVSMLQRGKDLLKDQHAPTFVSSEVQQLEHSWNDTYGQSIEALKTLKGSQKLWETYKQQKEDIQRLIEQANQELRRFGVTEFHDAAQVASDLQTKLELSSTLRKSSDEMMKKLRDTHSSLAAMMPPDRRSMLQREITETEERVQVVIESVHERVLTLQEHSARWSKFHTKLGELRTWTVQNAPQSIANIQDSSVSPEDRVRKIEALQKQIHDKITILKMLEEESQGLVKDDIEKPEARQLRDKIEKLHSAVEALNDSIEAQRDIATRNLATWQEYEVGIKKIKPWIEQAATKATSIASKPTTLSQAGEMLESARSFEKQCEEHLPRVQELSQVSRQIAGRTAAPDEVDAVYTRWNSIHDVAVQTSTKLDKLVSSWKTFETDATEFNSWLNTSEKTWLSEPNVKTPEASKLEQDLNRLKDFNKIISDRQAQLISLTQVSDHISHGLSLKGATGLKARVAEMKTRVGKLADTVRHHINLVSDALLSRQELHMKITDFENWMARLRSSIAEISEVDVDNVDTNLQAVHGYLQEHMEKQTSFGAIYEEIKHLLVQASPQEAATLDEIYRNLAEKYKALEDDLRQRKKCLEKWSELLSWHNDATAQLSHCKYQLEARKPNIADLERLSSELHVVQSKVTEWKKEIPIVDSSTGIHMRDKLGKPLTAANLINDLEARSVTMNTELSSKRDKLANLGARWDNFRKLEHKLTEEIFTTQTSLQQITYDVDTCEKLGPAVEKISDLVDDHKLREPDKDLLHHEGNSLVMEDQKAMTSVQVVVSSVDANWEKVHELLHEQRKKYAEMEADWQAYVEARERLTKLMEDSSNLSQAKMAVPNDVTEASAALEKHKRASEDLKKGKQFLGKMESKAQQIIKEASLMPNFKSESIESDLAKIRGYYQNAYAIIVDRTQSYETQVMIWKQIEDEKYELTRWLSDTNEALAGACERLTDAEYVQATLARYAEESLPHRLMWKSINANIKQLVKINNDADMPTLKSLEKLLEDQFLLIERTAERLESMTKRLSEAEKEIRQELKKSSDTISKIREDIIKCDDLTGENTKILGRINKCQELKAELDKSTEKLDEINGRIETPGEAWASHTMVSLRRELQALRQRREGVASHADKVSATLVAFLTKLYHEKFGALHRMVATHKEKVQWCELEESSDRYNLEVKMASLLDVGAGIVDCEARKADADSSLSLLETVESKETTMALKVERDKVAADLETLKQNHAKIKAVLERNIALWQRYESSSEDVVSWLKEAENKIRMEGSSLVDLPDVETKIDEIISFQKMAIAYQRDVDDLAELGDDILKVSPESRVGQYVGHLNTRYQAILKFLAQHLNKLQELKDGRDEFKAHVKELESWLDDAESKLKNFEGISGPKPITFYQSRLKELKAFADDREKGQAVLNKTAEAGEALFPRITPEQREAMRSELRNLRNRVDAVADSANVIYKRIESDMMHRSSFEDKYSQVKQWLVNAQAKLGDKQDLLPTLQEKKLALHSYRAIAQDVSVHRKILQQLQDRLGNVPDDEASEMLSSVIEAYDKLSGDVEDRIGIAEKHVSNHEAYLQTFDKTKDWISTIVNEAASLLDADLSVERESAKSRISQLDNILQQKSEGDRILEDCNQQLNIILEQTSIAGHPSLLKNFEQQKKVWEEFLVQCVGTREKLNRLFDKWAEFVKVVEALEAWTKNIESQVKDQSLKSTEEAKRAHLLKLKQLEEAIAAKAPEFNAAVERREDGFEAESELASRISRQATKYRALRNQAKEAVSRYEQFVREHAAFNERYNDFLTWVNDVRDELKKHSEIVGDLAVLQSRQKNIRDLGDTRTKENARFESVVDLGEKLYAQTSPDGREIVRQQLRKLRTLWDGFSEDLQVATQKLDQCLMQFAEFSLSQEQLTAWLRDVERAMHQHTELKRTLEEKRAQLQNHKIMHQEIMSHQSLVEAVCEKAQQLVDQTKDTSLNVYLQSIKQLFHNIVAKSQDLLENLEDCADKHHRFNLECDKLRDLMSSERSKFYGLSTSGERDDITRKLAILASVKSQSQAREQLGKIKEFVDAVSKSTAPKGQGALMNTVQALEDALQRDLSQIEEMESKLKASLQEWKDFEARSEAHAKWFNTMEAAFRDQQLQATLHEKEARLREFQEKRETILKAEKEIDEFVDKSHGFLYSSRVERLKPVISQISNRYQSLHALSKEVVNRCEAIVDEHRAYEEKLRSIDAWLTPLEQHLEALKKEEIGGNLEAKVSRLQVLLAEREQAENRLASLNAAGERILPATSARGRETVRHELRNARERWDNLAEGILEQQKKQDAQSLQWTSYQDTLQHILTWLDNMERATKDTSMAWSSLQEIRSKLLKGKTLHHEILAHKRIVEGISEKASALAQVAQAPSDVRDTVISVSSRYEKLVDASQKSIAGLEGLVEIFQQFHDLQKAYQDYQKQQWERLANYSDYTGNKATLQARLAKVIEVQDSQTEGELKLNVLEEHVAHSSQSLPPRSQESMERDLANLRFEQKKFATAVNDVVRSIEERIQQWSEYENSLERLLAWLSEAEACLKNYALKNTIDEKQEQLEKYLELQKLMESRTLDLKELINIGDHLDQTLIMNLRHHEAEFDKMSDDSSELIEISGESRFSASVQQVTSRFQSIQATAKELVKKCEQAVSDHASYFDRYKQCIEWLTASQSQYQSTRGNATATRQQLAENVETLRELISRQASATLLVNNTVEAGERLYPSTGSDGREIIRQQLLDLQEALETLYDGATATEREIQVKISRWSGFDESSEALDKWLDQTESQIKMEIELKTTLDEKRAQLHIYRTALHDVQGHQQDLFDLSDKADNLPDRTEKIDKILEALTKRHAAILKRLHGFVERYEGIVSDHQQYSTAVLDTDKWVSATHNAIIMWGSTDLERVALLTNLDRLKNLQRSLPEEEPRVQQIRGLGEKVIPGTLESGQVNITSQIDSSQVQWESIVSAIVTTIDKLEKKLAQWREFEAMKERCLTWIRDTDTKLHCVDLKPTFQEKKEQLERLRALQGEVRAKELEIDAYSERAQQLQKNTSSSNWTASEPGRKYRQISTKVKELNNRWQQYVTDHQDFDNQLSECTRWLEGIREKIDYCSDMSASTQKDLETKMEMVQDLLLYKEDGFAKVQGIVELAQAVLANTAPAGHRFINEALENLQSQWSGLASKMLETKTNLDDSINKWAGLLEQIQSINKTVEYMQTSIDEISQYQTTMTEKRSQLERIKALEEKVRCENIEVDSLKSKVGEMIASGQQGVAASEAQEILNKFDTLFERIKSLLSEREDQYKDHRLYKEAHDDLVAWLSRAREKIPSMKQRSLSDKLAIENAVAPLESLLNKKAQGELLVEHLQHTGQVVCASTSPQGQEVIRNDFRALSESFENLFREIQQQKNQLETTVAQWRDYKDEYERLSDWLQQFDILIKAQKNALLPNVQEKKKQVSEVKDILENLTKGQEQIDKFNKTASGLLSSHLDTYINNQLRHLNSRYQVQVNLAKDVLNKVETNLAQHQEYETNLGKAREWIDNAKQIIRQGTEAASSSSREELQSRLDKIQELLRKREEGQNLVHLTVNCGEKVVRNTRSDGREEINAQLKEIQNDWERLVKKISTTKVHLETSLLQWADYSSSYSQLQQWINDREAKLQQVCEHKVSKARKGLAGLSSLAIGERKANLRQTNSIVQDIVAFEPMIQSVATKAEDLQQATPATEISIKYETLSKQAQELYAKQKETVEQHQAFIDSGNEFVQWIRVAKERLGKCSEPTGDKESLASKISQLKVLESELPDGQKKLERALERGNAACQIADAEDKEIIEEEVALLQEEYDNYVDSLNSTKSLLEVGIVKWTEYEDQFSEATDWLTQTEQLVQPFNKLQDSLEEKKNVLERFQVHLQTLFDWQKELDRLNMKAQMLLETCADTRISNAITQLTTKYNALLSLAKEIMRRLELHYQEHQQHNTLYQECQDWIERTRDKLGECKEIPSTLAEVNNKLHTCKAIRQTLEQGQNKLRYALELKEKVIMNTEQNGAAKIQEDTENLKSEFDKLLADVEEARQRLSARATALEELNKLHRLITDWIEEVEGKVRPEEVYRNDLSEKRALLEKYRTAQRNIQGHADTIDRLKSRLREDDSIPKGPYETTIGKYEELRRLVTEKINNLEDQIGEHEKFQQAYNEAADWLRRMKVEIQQYSMTHGEREKVIEREKRVNEIASTMPKGEILISKVSDLSETVISSSGPEGQEAIRQDVRQLQLDWKALQTHCQESQRTLGNCINMWSQFSTALDAMKKWLDNFQNRVNAEQAKENKTPEDLARCKQLVDDAIRQKPVLEELNDMCEALLEMSAWGWARDKTVQLQSDYTALLTEAQGLVSKVEKNLSDHTEFLKAKKEMDDWLQTAHGSVQDCVGVGDIAWAKDKLETTKMVATRITEGQHLLSTLQNAFAKAINTALPEQQEELRSDMAELRSSWERLSIDLKTVQAQVKSILNRWEDHAEAYDRFKQWLTETESSMRSLPDTKGEIGEMKTLLERCKHIQEEAKGKKSDLDQIIEESVELSDWAKNNATRDQANVLQTRWESLGKLVDEQKQLVENEMQEYNGYHAALQDTEKWLLQISFQLMAHNSLYITNKEQTVQQIKQHESLLDEIRKYQHDLDQLKAKGQTQIDRYNSVNPVIKTTIQTQLQNVQESYNSLLGTAVQIKNRLDESLAKFEEYENTLESIMKNVDAYEPEIARELEAPLDTLESAERSLEGARNLHNKLQAEKARLALAVEACEAAAACVSRPGSPLDAPPVQIPAREVEVRTRLEDLIDQMQTHLANVTKSVGELEEQARQKNALRSWVNQQRALQAEWRSRPAKLRSEAALAELQAMNELLGSVGERRTRAMTELAIFRDGQDGDLEEGLNKLESELMEAIAEKQATQDLIQKYRAQVQDIQSWFDSLSKKVDVIERGSGLTIGQKIAAVKEITAEFESQGPRRLDEVKKLGDQVMDSVSNLDSQQIEEQIKSVERRYADIGKKLQRKSQVLDMTAQGIEATRKEIEDNRDWISEKKQQARVSGPLGFESKQADERVGALKSMLKEAEGKSVVIDSLEKRVGNMQNELESSEQQQLESDTKALRGEQAELCSIIREEISSATAAVDARRKLEADLEKARLWIKSKNNDLKKLSGYLPLRAAKVQEDISQHSGLESDIKSFNEKSLNDVLKQANNMLRDCSEEDRARLQSILAEINQDYDALKREAAEKQASLADLLQGRKSFESEIDKCQRWIKEAETATSSEIRTSSVDVLREQLVKYDRLKKEAKSYGEDVEKIIQQGKSILPTVSDADKLELNDQLKSMKDSHGRVADVINERAAALEKSIAEAEEAAARVAEAVQFMTDIQKELQDLNKPIGSRVEDVESMLNAYERILRDLKDNKAKLSDLQSANIGDLHGVVAQQDDLIRALEAQIAKLRALLLLRQQFIALITEIMTFITKYTGIVHDIEKHDGTTEEKIKRYDDVILKIQECEASLASATDKGQQIAADGSAADRNNVTEQLQSLKQQLQSLRRAVEAQREQHELAAAEHKRMAEELADILDWLENKEKEIKSRPLLERAVASVEAEIEKHKILCSSVNEYLDKIREIKESVRHEEGMPGSLKEMLSEATSLLSSLPREMEDRGVYLENNLKMRLDYNILSEKLHSWVREADIRLASDKDGLDFENILSDLEEHKIYFSSEASIRELVSQQIQQAADKIWPSLNSSEQEELSGEEQQHTQLLKNTLNTAKSHRARLEQGAETWRDYTQTLERVKAVIARTRFTDEPVTTLAGLQFNIQKITHALNDIQNQQFELDLMNERGQEVSHLADPANKKSIEAQLSVTSAEWQELVSGLEGRRDALEALSRHWEDLEARWSETETRVNATEERSKLVDSVVRSKAQLFDTIKALDELIGEAEKLQPATSEVKSLAGPVLSYLAAFTETPARVLEERIDKLEKSAEALVDSLRDKRRKASEDLEALANDESEVRRLKERLDSEHLRIAEFYVYGADQDSTEKELKDLGTYVEALVEEAKKLSGNIKARYQSSQQLVPSDLAQQLTQLELTAEETTQTMDEKQREQKRARTVRTDYLSDVEELQAWIRQAELKVQDRTVEPSQLRESLRQIQNELAPMSDKLEKLTKNGQTIVENSRDDPEKELIGKTINNLTEQLGQVRSWLDEKKQQVGDILDAWQRFLVLYDDVKAWIKKHQIFLNEPLIGIASLAQTRTRLREYSTAVKSCKQVNKNLSDMGKELESIGQMTNVGDLPEKLAEVEEAKVQVEGLLLERNALLQETCEEWEQYEKKLKDVKGWLEKATQSLDSAQNKKKPLRDQHAIREKMLSDIAIQKTKITMSVEKLQVHFRSGIDGDHYINEAVTKLLGELDALNDVVKEQMNSLEACLAQIDQYQQEIQQLRQQIVQVEQQLRTVLSPTYLPNDREKALQEQQIYRERIKSLQSRIQARAERTKLLVQRGTPDLDPLDP